MIPACSMSICATSSYLPFEGTGAVSNWRLTMPMATNLIDFSTISDVVIQLQYTALDGGKKFREDVAGLDALKPYSGAKLLSLSQQYSQQWYTFMTDDSNDAARTMTFDLANLLPPNLTKGRLVKLYFKLDVPQGVNASSATPYITFQLTEQLSQSVLLTPKNDFTCEFQPPPDTAKVAGKRAITFDLQATPPVLKDGFLNPAVVRNIMVILYFSAEVTWA